MALHSKKEFCDLCRIKSGDLSNYIKRGKVIASGDYIDMAIEINAAFMEKRQERLNNPVEVKQKAVKKEKETKKPEVKPPVYPEQKVPNVQAPALKMGFNELDKEMKVAQLEKIKHEAENKRMRNEQLAGKMIPTDLVQSVLKQHTASIVTAFKNGADLLVGEFAKKKDLNVNEQAELNGVLIDIINKSVNNAIIATSRMVEGIVGEFMEKREKGERASA